MVESAVDESYKPFTTREADVDGQRHADTGNSNSSATAKKGKGNSGNIVGGFVNAKPTGISEKQP